jgi:hypothetical protein
MGQNTRRRRFVKIVMLSNNYSDLYAKVFRVPTTHDVITTLFNPRYKKSHLDLLNLTLLGFQLVLFFILSRRASQIFFLFYFAFWRGAYDAGLGWVLTKQSRKKWVVREVQRLGWLDEKRHPAVRNWIRKQLADKMGKDYSFDVSGSFSWMKWSYDHYFRSSLWNTTPGCCFVKPWMSFSSSGFRCNNMETMLTSKQ